MFDCKGAGLKNMDLDIINYITEVNFAQKAILLFSLSSILFLVLQCMENYYPWILNLIYIFEMPWLMNAGFKVTSSWLNSHILISLMQHILHLELLTIIQT